MTVLMIPSVLTHLWASNAVVLPDLLTWMEMEETASVGSYRQHYDCLSMCVITNMLACLFQILTSVWRIQGTVMPMPSVSTQWALFSAYV